MFLKSISSLVKESLLLGSNCKYKVLSLECKSNGANVNCEIIESGILITLKLDSIIADNKLRFFGPKDILCLSDAYKKEQRVYQSLTNDGKYYNAITTAFTVLLLISNIAEIKICNFFGYAIGAGTLVFPMLYVLNDVLTEVYGFTASRRTIWTALLYNCLVSAFIYVVILLPASNHWEGQNAFEQVFFTSPRIVIASVVSYFIGELLNATIISVLKIRFRGQFFAIRAIVSTLFGSFVESLMFSCIAFWGRIPPNELVEMVALLTIIKVLYEILIMPVTINLVAFLKKAEGDETFEKPSPESIISKINDGQKLNVKANYEYN